MSLTPIRARDIPLPKFKILLYGDSGAGKTWLSSTCKNVAVLLTEDNGLQSIRHANPDAQVFLVHNVNEFREFMMMALKGELKAMGIETIVFDGLTEIQRLMKDEILAKKGGVMAIQDWGDLTERMRKLMRMLRTLDYNVIATALMSAELEEATGIRRIAPAFEGKKLGNEVAQYFNLVGYVSRRSIGQDEHGAPKFERFVTFDGPAKVICKSCFPITGTLTGPVQPWLDTLAAAPQAHSDNTTQSQKPPGE